MNGYRILIVEDDAIIAAHLRTVLDHAGFEVAALVPSGEDALAGLDEWQPDVVMMDVRLRGQLNGIETGEAAYARTGCGIVFLSAFSMRSTSLLDPAKPFGYLNKPVHDEELCKAIRTVILRKDLIRKTMDNRQILRDHAETIGEQISSKLSIFKGEKTSDEIRREVEDATKEILRQIAAG